MVRRIYTLCLRANIRCAGSLSLTSNRIPLQSPERVCIQAGIDGRLHILHPPVELYALATGKTAGACEDPRSQAADRYAIVTNVNTESYSSRTPGWALKALGLGHQVPFGMYVLYPTPRTFRIYFGSAGSSPNLSRSFFTKVRTSPTVALLRWLPHQANQLVICHYFPFPER